MQHVLPDKAVPQTYKTGIPTIIVGVDPKTGQRFTDHSAEVYAGWCNAAKGMDAWGALNASFGNLWKATAEINESLFPHVQWSRDYRTDSGGAGEYGHHAARGNLADRVVPLIRDVCIACMVHRHAQRVGKGFAGIPSPERTGRLRR